MAGYIGAQPFTKASYDKELHIATDGQTVFNVVYNVHFLDVLVNGVEVNTTDYVANDGATVTFNSPLVVGDEVTFKIWGTFNVADVVTPTGIDLNNTTLSATGIYMSTVELNIPAGSPFDGTILTPGGLDYLSYQRNVGAIAIGAIPISVVAATSGTIYSNVYSSSFQSTGSTGTTAGRVSSSIMAGSWRYIGPDVAISTGGYVHGLFLRVA